MASTEKESLNGPSIDSMLRGLTERPNVESTLILSRRDGSVIRSSVVASGERKRASGVGTGYGWTPSEQGDQASTTPVAGRDAGVAAGKQLEGQESNTPKPVEVLASTIFDFVTNAAALGLTLGSVSRGSAQESPAGVALTGQPTTRQEAQEDEQDSSAAEDEIQLLRLRTRAQEIIIFPDAKYIACVVQRVGKSGAEKR